MHILIECETFDDLGGWVVETQSREAMGSFWIFAHGIGHPVKNASTKVKLPHGGIWYFYARTRNWSAIWKRGHAAGQFLLLVDGSPLPVTLGTNGSKWDWQKAGERELTGGQHQLELQDLTGFDGRCDAIFLTDDPHDLPPNGLDTLQKFRRDACHTQIEEDPLLYDLIVCGGGMAGLCAGLSAMNQGLKTLILQDRPVAGGCGSSEVRVWTGGDTELGLYPRLGRLARLLGPICGRPRMKKYRELFEDDRKAIPFREQENLLLNEAVIQVETDPADPRTIAAVITRSVRTGRETRRRARFFTDASGDAFLARQTGCEVMYGSEGREEFGEFLAPSQWENTVMGHSVLWETRKLDHPVTFPDIDWGLPFTEENALHRFNSQWDWEAGQFRNQVTDIEEIRDYGLMACYGNWSFLKNRSCRKKEWENMDLEWVSPIGGKRESYRVRGDLVLTLNDILQTKEYPDGTGCATWSIDLHFADPENCATFPEPFQACAYHLQLPEPYPVPYRCMYARDMNNLFLAGRCLSLSHIAFSCVRVMRTLGMLGEVVGMAAALAVKKQCSCREVYTRYLKELKEKMIQGAEPLPPVRKKYDAYYDAYHFMRPVGMYGNAKEDCWVYHDCDGQPKQEIPAGLQKCIEALNLNRKPYAEIDRTVAEKSVHPGANDSDSEKNQNTP